MRAAGSDSVLYDVGQAYADEAAQREKWGRADFGNIARIRPAEDFNGKIFGCLSGGSLGF